ncbi:MAG: pilus assembly protein TadG-related protein [Pseudomonadota bacterium]
MKRQRGSIMVLAAGLILTLTGFAILAIDLGRIFIVRNEMQNAADSAALAGANCLMRTTVAGTSDCSATMATAINWTGAAAKAQDQLGKNSAANVPISTVDTGHSIEVGYWRLGCAGGGCTPGPSGGSFSTTFSPLTNYDKPAVKVTITKDTGKNSGPIFMLSKVMFGASDVPMFAAAVAVISSPGTVMQNNLIPQAIDKCLYDQYWDYTTMSPKLATSTNLQVLDNTGKTIDVPQTIGQPWVFRIGSAYHYPGCQAGQWSSFDSVDPSAAYAKWLIQNGNPSPLDVGDSIYIQPGTETSLYKELGEKYPNLPVDVTVMVVDYNLSTQGQTPIYAFAGFRITDIKGGSGKYIEGHFIKSAISSGSSGVGPFFGSYTPPRIAY